MPPDSWPLCCLLPYTVNRIWQKWCRVGGKWLTASSWVSGGVCYQATLSAKPGVRSSSCKEKPCVSSHIRGPSWASNLNRESCDKLFWTFSPPEPSSNSSHLTRTTGDQLTWKPSTPVANRTMRTINELVQTNALGTVCYSSTHTRSTCLLGFQFYNSNSED